MLGTHAPAALTAGAAAAVPVRAACLDLALRRLPRPRRPLALGWRDPHCLSTHSAVARLAPDDGALVHVLRYHGAQPAQPGIDRARLEDLMDAAQPGWRDLIVHQRFLPDLEVASDLPTAASGGLPGRPSSDQGGGLHLAGDWVGPVGLLSDASLASAAAAGAGAAAWSRRTVGAPA